MADSHSHHTILAHLIRVECCECTRRWIVGISENGNRLYCPHCGAHCYTADIDECDAPPTPCVAVITKDGIEGFLSRTNTGSLEVVFYFRDGIVFLTYNQAISALREFSPSDCYLPWAIVGVNNDGTRGMRRIVNS